MFSALSFSAPFDYQGQLFKGSVSSEKLASWTMASTHISALPVAKDFDPMGGEYWLLVKDMPDQTSAIQITGSWFDQFEVYVYEKDQLVYVDEDGPHIKYKKGYSNGLTMVSLGHVTPTKVIYAALQHHIKPSDSSYVSLVKPPTSLQLVLHVNAPYYASAPKIHFLDENQKISKAHINLTAINILTGLLLGLLLYNLFLYFSTGKRVFIRYSVLMFMVGLSMPMYMQIYPWLLGFPALNQNFGLTVPSIIFSILLLHLVASLWFVRGFLKLGKQPDIYSTLNLWAIAITIVFTVVIVFLPVATAFILGNIFGLPILILNIACGVNRYRNGMKQALFYVIAFSSIPITFVSVRLAYMGVVGISIDDTLLIYGSYAVEGILLSIAVGSLYRQQSEDIRLARLDANTDSLCLVYNRRAFMDNLWLDKIAINHDQCYSISIVDIDNLKGNNDEQGHVSGDKLIIHTASLLKKMMAECLVFRLGGDEFALIYRTSKEEYDEEVMALNVRFEQLHKEVKDKWPSSGVSYGFSSFLGEDDLPSAVREADANMYNIKALRSKR